MSTDTAILIAFFIITAVVIFLLRRAMNGRVQAMEDDMKKAASLRGWTFDKTIERNYRIYTFTGTVPSRNSRGSSSRASP